MTKEYEKLKDLIHPLTLRETDELRRLHLLDLRRLSPDELQILTSKTLELICPDQGWKDEITIPEARELVLEVMKMSFDKNYQIKKGRLH